MIRSEMGEDRTCMKVDVWSSGGKVKPSKRTVGDCHWSHVHWVRPCLWVNKKILIWGDPPLVAMHVVDPQKEEQWTAPCETM